MQAISRGVSVRYTLFLVIPPLSKTAVGITICMQGIYFPTNSQGDSRHCMVATWSCSLCGLPRPCVSRAVPPALVSVVAVSACRRSPLRSAPSCAFPAAASFPFAGSWGGSVFVPLVAVFPSVYRLASLVVTLRVAVFLSVGSFLRETSRRRSSRVSVATLPAKSPRSYSFKRTSSPVVFPPAVVHYRGHRHPQKGGGAAVGFFKPSRLPSLDPPARHQLHARPTQP